jgi:hypothetical protein
MKKYNSVRMYDAYDMHGYVWLHIADREEQGAPALLTVNFL